MAVIDESRNVLVVRIVYDGPALSGKTTSLAALARGLSSRLDSPAEMAGRTLFFDWVDYVGGLFDGRQIRCQIVSAPGQLDLAHRRRFLIENADSLVVVLDTRRHEWDFGLQWVRETAAACRAHEPPVGLLVQANKRDARDAVSDDELRSSLNRIAPMAIVPSTATSGDGIRETFVLAVRLALDRVRALSAAGRLEKGRPLQDAPDELLERLKGLDAEGAVTTSLERERDPLFGFHSDRPPPTSSVPPAKALDDEELPFVPDPMMPGGMIWPPVDGRTLLHEVAKLSIQPTRTGRTDWAGSGSGFRFHSRGRAIYGDALSARRELVEWARLHSANLAHLSPGRAVILADAGGGRLRLWQIVRAEATLRERLAAALGILDPNQVAREVWSVAVQLSAAREFFQSTTVQLPCTLWTVAANVSTRPAFVGLMPSRDAEAAPEPAGRDLLVRELSPQLRQLRRARVDYSEVVKHVAALAERTPPHGPERVLAEIMSEA
jgi:signal recognition particle receptor subunit beta